jgi:predicted lipoprotein with Yx(FWY)xxD motif
MSSPLPRSAAAAALVALALAIAACGDSSDSSGSNDSATVSVKQVDGVGAVLVNDRGHALYTPDQEANGTIRCKGSCTRFWVPLKPGAATPTAGSDVSGKLATIRRPDGGSQVTYAGKPLYTFSRDPGPGKVTGDGFRDSFRGTSFTWHAVTSKGTSNGGSQSRSYGY